MGKHLSDEELMDVAEGAAGPGLRSHVEECGACRGRVDEAREGLALAPRAEVPEPPAPYWEAFRGQLERRIEGERVVARPHWPGVLAMAALIFVSVGVLAFWPSSPLREPSPVREATLPAWTPLPPPEEDGGLEVLRAVARSPEDLAPAAGCQGGVPECLVSLSEDESRALAEDLRRDLLAGAL